MNRARAADASETLVRETTAVFKPDVIVKREFMRWSSRLRTFGGKLKLERPRPAGSRLFEHPALGVLFFLAGPLHPLVEVLLLFAFGALDLRRAIAL